MNYFYDGEVIPHYKHCLLDKKNGVGRGVSGVIYPFPFEKLINIGYK
jgi:hypothetical protein